MRLSAFLDFLGIVLVVAAVVFLKFFGRILENVVDGVWYHVLLGIAGILLVVVYVRMIMSRIPDYFIDERNVRKAATVGHVIASVLVFVYLVTYFDQYYSRNDTYEKKVRVIKTMKNYKYKTLYMKVDMGDREERFNPEHQVWDAVEAGDSLVLVIGKGAFGYDHALEFQSQKN